MNLTAKLKHKTETDNENCKLKEELNDYKQKYFDTQKKYLQAND